MLFKLLILSINHQIESLLFF